MEVALVQESSRIEDGLTESKRIQLATEAYAKFMDVLLPGWEEDEQYRDTPKRVAKSFVTDLFKGMYSLSPNIKSFPSEGYKGMVFSGKIPVHSLCGHHHLPIAGHAYIAYIVGEHDDARVIGLSKFNRIVKHYSRRPQIQEGLTKEIHNHINTVCENNRGVAVMIEAAHFCTCHRGVMDNSRMVTTEVSGFFFSNEVGSKDEFLRYIDLLKTHA